MEIFRAGQTPSRPGPAEWFTGRVRIDVLFNPAAPDRVQREGGPVEEIRPGDVVWFEPGEKHWHGAAPEVAMTHIALQEVQGGKVVDWLEHVRDAEYGG